jgi:enoyl-CoA hydratase/carnithine racemase
MTSATSNVAWRLEQSTTGAVTLWFDQPGRAHNILTAAALDELETCLEKVAGDSAIRSLLIRSAKPAGFCAGADLRAILDCSRSADAERYTERGLAVFDRLRGLAIPTAAVVHGVCLGGGLELALACRRRIGLASSAPLQMGSPEVQLGLIPGWGAIDALPRLIGPEAALDLLITGRSIGYLQARTAGLVDRLASDDDSLEDLIVSEPNSASKPTSSAEEWNAAWTEARQRIDDQPGEFPEAQLEILSIVAIDVAHGPQAARKATIKALGELCLSENVKAAITAFFNPDRTGAHD